MNREILKKPHKKGISPNKAGRLNEAAHAVSSLNLPDCFSYRSFTSSQPADCYRSDPLLLQAEASAA